MLAFITSIRHPDNSSDYQRVETLLSETLKSVANQSSDSYVLIVVGNRRPSFGLPEKAHFIEVDYEAPIARVGPHAAREDVIRDKGAKIGVGLVAARQYQPSHVMIFDADDFVSNKVAEHIERSEPDCGWVIRNGWMYSRARNVVRPISEFHRTCGTSFIMPYGAYAVPNLIDIDAPQQEIERAFGERFHQVIGAHRNAREWFVDHGYVLKDLPFRGAIYHVDTGENHSGKSMTGIGRPLGQALVAEFGVSSSMGRIASIWSAYGPLPAAQTLATLGPRVIRRLKQR